MLLRYPGGKSRGPICKRLVDLISDRYQPGYVFGDTFFGGGGVTFCLLKKGIIDTLLINDFDKAVHDLWNCVIEQPGELCRRVKLFKPSVDKFIRFKQAIIDNGSTNLGFEMLVVNRTSHAGRGTKAGPQGGLKQNGRYKIDCRWNPDTLSSNIWKAHDLLTRVNLIGGRCHNKSYENLLDCADLHYFDPPYWEIGEELYRCAFTEDDHLSFYKQLNARRNWVLSYNNHPHVLDLYRKFTLEVGSVAGNGGTKKSSEVIICN
jgi:DNA adenine methylase